MSTYKDEKGEIMFKRILVISLSFYMCVLVLCSCSSGIGKEGISLDEYKKIQTDMRLTDVQDIVGGDGKQLSEHKETTDEYYKYTYLYRFDGEKSGYAEIEFTLYSYFDGFKMDLSGPRVTGKQQFDLS